MSLDLFRNKRDQIYSLQTENTHRRRTLFDIKKQMENLRTEFQILSQNYDNTENEIKLKFEEMENLQKNYHTIKIYTDMSHDERRNKASYGGLIIENGAMTTINGFLDSLNFNQFSVMYETMAAFTAVWWAANQWPSSILQIYSDCDLTISILEKKIRQQRLEAIDYKQFLYTKLEEYLGSHMHRIFPCWIPRESPEIKLCDALARRKLDLTPQSTVWLRMLKLVQGDKKGKWTSESQKILHNYHRYRKRNDRLRNDCGFSTFPPI